MITSVRGEFAYPLQPLIEKVGKFADLFCVKLLVFGFLFWIIRNLYLFLHEFLFILYIYNQHYLLTNKKAYEKVYTFGYCCLNVGNSICSEACYYSFSNA